MSSLTRFQASTWSLAKFLFYNTKTSFITYSVFVTARRKGVQFRCVVRRIFPQWTERRVGAVSTGSSMLAARRRAHSFICFDLLGGRLRMCRDEAVIFHYLMKSMIVHHLRNKYKHCTCCC